VIRDPVEQLPREELRELQLERLRGTFGVEVSSLEDVASLPFAVKSDLRDAYPFGRLRVPVGSLARLHASSGTHGKPTVVGYTPGDLDAWTELMARCMTMAGVRPGMLIHNANTYGLFTGGHGFHQGAERLGCPVLPVSCCCTTSAGRCSARRRRTRS
jgi:phenylacetate-CoA ligase